MVLISAKTHNRSRFSVRCFCSLRRRGVRLKSLCIGSCKNNYFGNVNAYYDRRAGYVIILRLTRAELDDDLMRLLV